MHPVPARSRLRPAARHCRHGGCLPFGLSSALAQTTRRPAPAGVIGQSAPLRSPPPTSMACSSARRSSRLCAPSRKGRWRTRPSSSARSNRSATTGASSTSNSSRPPRASRDLEERIAKTQERLNLSTRANEACGRSLEERRSVIAEVLAALQRIGRHAPPADPDARRGCAAVRSLRHDAGRGTARDAASDRMLVASDLGELVRLRKQITDERDKLARDLFVLADERQRLSLLIEERQKKQADVEKALAEERQRAARARAPSQRRQGSDRQARTGAGFGRPRVPPSGPFGRRQKSAGYPTRPRRPQGPRTAGSGHRVRVRQGNAAATRQWGENQGIWRPRRHRRHRKGPVDRRPGRAARSRLRVMAGWFIPEPSAIMANS